MKQARNQLLLYSFLSVFVLLTVLLGIINCVNFTMAARDADTLTSMIAQQRGGFAPENKPSEKPASQPGADSAQSQFQGPGRGFGPMGPSSPEMGESLRYFTFAFSGEEARCTAFHLSAFTQEEAERWARSLRNEGTGWTHGTYRYRVYERDGQSFVTVIDQGRELLPSYRILIISACGEVLGLALCALFLHWAGKRLFAPLEEADRKQKEFIAGIEQEFQLPLTVISADTELLERAGGPNDQSRSIHRQVRRMSALLGRLRNLALFQEESRARQNVTEFLHAELDRRGEDFAARGLTLEQTLEENVLLEFDPEALHRVCAELVDNALRFAVSRARFTLRREGERVVLLAENDTHLPNGSCDQVFDRFTVLEKSGEEHVGLGLAAVKETAKHYHGRVSAKVAEGTFTLRLAL